VSPKERKSRIFKKSRPHFRKADLMNLDGSYGDDMKILWAAYKAGSFQAPEGMTDAQFAEWILANARLFQNVWLAEDESKAFKSGKGAIAVVCTNNQGLMVTVEGQPFKWATRKNILRTAVGFLHMVTMSHKTGIVMVKGNEKTRSFLDHLGKYKLLFYVGKTNTNEFLYSVRGRGSD
jgi:hypothetical protein